MGNFSPSEGHNSAWSRTPEHDNMVVEVAEWFREKGAPKSSFSINHRVKNKFVEKIIQAKKSYIECEFMYEERRTFFSDITLITWIDYKCEADENDKVISYLNNGRYENHLILEIKPKIYSAGAVLRQIKIQEANFKKWAELEQQKHPSYKALYSTVVPVFKAGDPSIEIFSRMCSCGRSFYIWNGSVIEEVSYGGVIEEVA